jgi:aspartate aminotransferase-like enzyme
MLADAIRRSDVDAVTLVHSETSTGALAPLEDLAAVAREFENVVLLVDGTTSVAASPVEADEWGLDFVLCGSQAALGLPPGLALGVASERMVDRARRMPERGAYLDLVAFAEAAEKRQPAHTAAIPLICALVLQLERIDSAGGVARRWERHDLMRLKVEDWVDGRGGELGFRFLSDKGRRSWTVSCLRVPEGKNGRGIAKGLEASGWVIGSGYGPLKTETIRIGHMGDHSVKGVGELLAAIEGLSADSGSYASVPD